jgi:hypothetical protein
MVDTVKKASSKAKDTTKEKAATKPRKAAAGNGNGAANPNGVSNVTQMKLSHQQVAELAHRFWNDRGRQHGHDAEDWFRAEQELRAKAS